MNAADIGYKAAWFLGRPAAKKIYGALAIGAAYVAGEVIAKKIVLPAVEKAPKVVGDIKTKAAQVKILTTMILIPAAKAKAQSIFSRKAKVAKATPVAAESPAKVTIIEMDQFPAHAVAPGIPEEDLI